MFYRKDLNPGHIKSLLVRPLKQSLAVFKRNAGAGRVKSETDNLPYKACKGITGKITKAGNHSVSIYSNTEADNQASLVVDSIAKQCVEAGNQSKLSTNAGQGGCLHASETVICRANAGAGSLVNNKVQVYPNKAGCISDETNIVDIAKHNKATMEGPGTELNCEGGGAVNTSIETRLLYDVNAYKDDKFVNSIIYGDTYKADKAVGEGPTYSLCKQQSSHNFGFIPLTEPILPETSVSSSDTIQCPIELHKMVKKFNKPNFLGARIPVKSQLNIDQWQTYLVDYWDKQLLEFLQFGFPLGFNRQCPLKNDNTNHKSAMEYPQDIDAYLTEERDFGAIIGPFAEHPIENAHFSPFMTRFKPNSSNRRVIIDLSWPKGYSVNDGVEKDGYMGSEFRLTFPTLDDLTQRLVKLGRGAHIYKIDVSRAFRHLKVDPFDYDLLGLTWGGTYVDTCLPFGTRHGSQFFQRTSDAVRYVMRQMNYDIINYIDYFLGYGTPSVADASFHALLDVMAKLGLTISQKKLVRPTTKAICLGIEVDTVAGTVAIPPDKLADVKAMVNHWDQKHYCTKRELQSLLGTLLYVHKCVRPARTFLNRMLDLLRHAPNPSRIVLTEDFK